MWYNYIINKRWERIIIFINNIIETTGTAETTNSDTIECIMQLDNSQILFCNINVSEFHNALDDLSNGKIRIFGVIKRDISEIAFNIIVKNYFKRKDIPYSIITTLYQKRVFNIVYIGDDNMTIAKSDNDEVVEVEVEEIEEFGDISEVIKNKYVADIRYNNDVITNPLTTVQKKHQQNQDTTLMIKPSDSLSLDTKQRNTLNKLSKLVENGDLLSVVKYGSEIANKMKTINNQTNKLVNNKIDDQSINLVSSLEKIMSKVDINEVNNLNVTKKKGLLGLFGKVGDKTAKLKLKYTNINDELASMYSTFKEWDVSIQNNNKNIESIKTSHKDAIYDLDELINVAQIQLDDMKATYSETLIDKEKIDVVQQQIVELQMQKQSSIQQVESLQIIQRTNYTVFRKIQSVYSSTMPIFEAQITNRLFVKEHSQIIDSLTGLDTLRNELMVSSAEHTIQSGENALKMLDNSDCIEAFAKVNEIISNGKMELARIQQDMIDDNKSKIDLLEDLSTK